MWPLLDFLCLPYSFLDIFYRREVRIKPLSSKSVEGVVVGYKRAQIVAAPIVEYRVDGQTYRNSLKYYRLVRATLPWKTNQVASDIDLMAQRITIYTNSTVSKGNLFQDAFPLGSSMTVWYNPACPKESYVERYGGLDRLFKRQMWIGIWMLILLPILAVVAITMGMKYKWWISPNWIKDEEKSPTYRWFQTEEKVHLGLFSSVFFKKWKKKTLKNSDTSAFLRVFTIW